MTVKTHIVILTALTLLIGTIIVLSNPLIISQIHNNIKRIARTIDITHTSKAEAFYKDNNINFADSRNNASVINIGSTTNKAGIWHSAMVDESGYEQVSQKAINEFENNSGKKLALVVFSNDWYNGISFPGSKANIIKQNNATPIIRIAPWKSNGQNLSNAGPYTMSNILNGQHDDALIEWAKAAKSFGSPILVDFGYEPNTNYFPWSKQGAAMYIDAYRHIVTIFREQNATNVYFVYHPDLSSNVDEIKKWYPGDKYIDWILASAYGEDGDIGCLGVLNKSSNQLTAISPSKPLGIEEWGIGSPTDTKNTLNSLAQNKFPKLKILSIWNEGPAGGKDRRIEQSPEMLNAYKEGIANSFYLSSNFNPTLPNS
jgi:beta-mannanase